MHDDNIVASLWICNTIIIRFEIIVTECRLIEVYMMLRATAAATAAAAYIYERNGKKKRKKNIYIIQSYSFALYYAKDICII